MLNRRLQVLLDDTRFRRLAREAERQGTSVGTVVRQALDATLPVEETELRRTAMERFLAADPVPVPADPADLRAELDAAHSRHVR